MISTSEKKLINLTAEGAPIKSVSSITTNGISNVTPSCIVVSSYAPCTYNCLRVLFLELEITFVIDVNIIGKQTYYYTLM